MKKIIAFAVLLVTALTLTGCFAKDIKLSGTYVSELDKEQYLKFSGESKVDIHLGGAKVTGSYIVLDQLVMINAGTGDAITLVAKDDKTLYSGTVAFVKQGFWKKHWWKVVLVLVGLSIISGIYKLITGRDLGDDLERLEDRMEEKFENSGEDKPKDKLDQ